MRYLAVESFDNLSVGERDAPFVSTSAKTDTERTEAHRYLVAQLLHLLPNNKDREIVELMLDGLRPREIAKTIGLTSGSVQKRWERIRIWLQPIALNLYQINLIRSLLIKSALRGTGTSRYKLG